MWDVIRYIVIFLFAIGSFLLTVELLCLQLCFGARLLTIGVLLLTMGSASNKQINGL